MNRKKLTLGLFLSLAMAVAWLAYNSMRQEGLAVTKVKSKIEGVRKIHRLIKTRTGEEEIGYAENYLAEEYLKRASTKPLSAARTTQNIPWIERGPGNIGGRTRTILVDAADNDGNTWLIGTAGGGIWRTANAGVDWTNVSPFLPNLSVVTIAQSPANPSVVYAGTGEGGLGGNFVNGFGIAKSFDGGLTWVLLNATTPTNSNDFLNTNRIIVHPDNENIVYAATSNGIRQSFTSAIMRSVDGGNSWQKIFDANSQVQQIVFDPQDPNTIYATLILQGVFKSTDGGSSWNITPLESAVTAGGGITERTEIAISPTNPNKIYASVSYASRSGSGLFWSTDKGASWQQVLDEEEQGTDFLIQGEYDNCIVVDPTNENKVFWGGVQLYTADIQENLISVSGRDFIGVDQEGTTSFLSFVTFNSGTHFNNSFEITDPTNTPNIEVRFGQGSQKAHRFTVPEGRTFGVPDSQYSYEDYVDVPFQVWDIDNNRQLMVSFRDQERDGSFNLNPEGLDPDESSNREYLYIHSLTYSEEPSANLSVSGGHAISRYVFIWPTLTAGATWDENNLPSSILRIKFGNIEFQSADITLLPGNDQVHVDHHFLIYKDANTFISANDGGIGFTSDGGQTFTERELGLVTSQYYSADKKPGSQIYIGGTQDNDVNLSLVENPNSASEYEDNALTQIFADGFEVVWNRDGQRILASNQFNFIFRSDDAGQNWRASNAGLADSDIFGEDPSAPFFTKLAYSKFGPDRAFAVSQNGVWRSEDFGESWRLVRIPRQWGGSLDVEVSDVNVDVIWAGGALDEFRKIYVSQDGGVSFEAVNIFDQFPLKGNITTIVPGPNSEAAAFLVFSQANEPKILKTTDFGNTWEDITGFVNGSSTRGFPDVGVFSLLVFPDGRQMWAGTELGIYETFDGGESWAPLVSDFPAVAVWDMKVVNGEIVVASHGRGIWTADLALDYANVGTQLVLNTEAQIAEDFTVFPNPTTGTFGIRGVSDLQKVEIWNVSGQLVKAYDTSLDPGDSYSLETEKGLFIVKVLTPEGVLQKRLIVN